MPNLVWTSSAVRLGWFLDDDGKLTSVHGPSICVSSGGGPVEALRKLREQGYFGDVTVVAPPAHEDMRTGKPCTECDELVAQIARYKLS